MISSKNIVRGSVLALSIALVGTAAWAQDEKPIDWKTGGKWSHLSRYIGTYDYASVLEDKAVKSQLDSMLKGQDINLKSEMEVSAPIGFENDCLILKGNQYHKGNEHQTYMQVCLYEGNINLAVMKKGTITVFSRANEYMYLTDGMKTWIYFQNHSTDLQTKPDNVQFIVQAP